jgi:hypothetical protein
MLTLSQAHLSLLDACPREFQYRILEGLSAPIDPALQARLAWGEGLHRLIEQASLGLDLEPLLRLHPEFAPPLAKLQRALGPGGPMLAGQNYHSEHPRQLSLAGFGLIAVYDALVLGADRAEILDWKSYGKPRRSEALRDHWQTRLYRYLLVETSDYRPEQVTMTYWFLGEGPEEGPDNGPDNGPEDRPEAEADCLTFDYDDRQHQQTQVELLERFARLDRGLTTYGAGLAAIGGADASGVEDPPQSQMQPESGSFESGSFESRPFESRPFEQVADRSRCGGCAFRLRCGRETLPDLDWQRLPELEP